MRYVEFQRNKSFLLMRNKTAAIWNFQHNLDHFMCLAGRTITSFTWLFSSSCFRRLIIVHLSGCITSLSGGRLEQWHRLFIFKVCIEEQKPLEFGACADRLHQGRASREGWFLFISLLGCVLASCACSVLHF